jgi:hypothetical protein
MGLGAERSRKGLLQLILSIPTTSGPKRGLLMTPRDALSYVIAP